MSSRPRIILSGPPASGKGTQCALIVKKYGCVHVSTGDLLRAEVKQQTEIGNYINPMMANGDLIEDEIVIDLVEDQFYNEKQWKIFLGDIKAAETKNKG